LTLSHDRSTYGLHIQRCLQDTLHYTKVLAGCLYTCQSNGSLIAPHIHMMADCTESWPKDDISDAVICDASVFWYWMRCAISLLTRNEVLRRKQRRWIPGCIRPEACNPGVDEWAKVTEFIARHHLLQILQLDPTVVLIEPFRMIQHFNTALNFQRCSQVASNCCPSVHTPQRAIVFHELVKNAEF